MPITNVNRVVAQEGRLHPHIKNNWRIYFMFSRRDQLAERMAEMTDSRTSLPILKNQLLVAMQILSQDNTLPWEVEFSYPSLEVEERTVRRQNIEVKYGGWPRIGRSSLTIYHWAESPLVGFFTAWAQMAQGVSRVLPDEGYTFVREREIARVPPVIYKVNAYVELIGQGHEGISKGKWFLYGVFPNSVSMDDLKNDGDGDEQRPRVSFSIDYAKPASLQPEGSNLNANQFETYRLNLRNSTPQQVPDSPSDFSNFV